MISPAEQQPTLSYEQLQSRLVHEGIHDTRELIDREQIEANAWQLIHNRNQLSQPETLRSEWNNNSRTALMEALMESGHLSRVEIRGTRDEVRQTVRSRLLNGWSDKLPEHEKQRRFSEICEVLITEKVEDLILEGILPGDTEVGFISDYTGGNYSKEQIAELGYRQKNKKGMVRSTSFVQHEDGTFSRVIEQISRSNGLWPTTFAFLQNSGLQIEQGKPADLIAMEKPFIYSRKDYMNAVVDIQRILDTYAGSNIKYGDKLADKPKHPAYENLREESARREKEIEFYIENLGEFEKKLDVLEKQGKITYAERLNHFKNEVQSILEAICTLAPEYAKDCFGEKTVDYYIEASNAAAAGEWDLVRMNHQKARGLQDIVTVCGMSISSDTANELGIELSDVTNLVKKGKESWVWTTGVCRMKKCPSPKPTKVGPCKICLPCQDVFDGKKPKVLTENKPTKNIFHIDFGKKEKSNKQTIFDKIAA